MMTWSDTSTSECPACGATVRVGIMSLATMCACGLYYVDADEWRGWYYSVAHFMRGGAPIPAPTTTT
jgi:hypothetical protein